MKIDKVNKRSEKMRSDLYYFSNDINTTLDEKNEAIFNSKTSRGCTVLSEDDLYSTIDKVINCRKKIYYNEFVIEPIISSIKLICDLDASDKLDIDEQLELKSLIESILFVIKTKLPTLEYKGNVDNIDENILITKNTSPHKTSYHIIFNNIVVSTSLMKNIKGYMSEVSCSLSKFIDTCIYRKNTQFRFIYSMKKSCNHYHVPEFIYNKGLLNKFEDLSKETISYFSIWKLHNNFGGIKILSVKTREYQNHLQEEIDRNIVETPYYIKYFDGRALFYYLKKKILYKIGDPIEAEDFIGRSGFELNEEVTWTFESCKSCNRKHNHSFKIIFDKHRFLFLKNGNPNKCRAGPFGDRYPVMEVSDLCRYIRTLDIVRKIGQKSYLIWRDKQWSEISEDSLFKHIILEEYFGESLRKDEENLFLDPKQSILQTMDIYIGDRFMKDTKDPYLVKLENGYFDLINFRFIEHSEETKNIYMIPKIDLVYKEKEKMSREELDDYNSRRLELQDVLDQIILKSEDEESVNTFKANVSSILYSGHKPVITFFVGETKSGKSTIKLLIKTLLGNAFTPLSVEDYTSKLISNKGDPWKGDLSYKLASFASEMSKDDYIRAQSVKLLTEKFINARKMYSNDKSQINYLTQFVDTNFNPRFDYPNDPAVRRRYAVVNFKSYFYSENEIDKELIANGRQTWPINEKVESKINGKYFNLPLFDILTEWFRDIHGNSIKLIDCSKTYNQGITMNDKYYLGVFLANTVHLGNVKIFQVIKEPVRGKYMEYHYKILNDGTSFVYLGCNKNHVIQELSKLIPDEKREEFKEFLGRYIQKDYTTRCLKTDLIEFPMM